MIHFILLHYGQLLHLGLYVVFDLFEEVRKQKVPVVLNQKLDFPSSKCFVFNHEQSKRSSCGHSHVPRRSSRKPICSLRESMRSSCWKEWDSRVVFSDKPSSSDSGKKLLKGANTNCNFCAAREKTGEEMRGKRTTLQKRTITHLVNKKINVTYSNNYTLTATLSACSTKHTQDSNKTHKKKIKKPLSRSGISKNLWFGY